MVPIVVGILVGKMMGVFGRLEQGGGRFELHRVVVAVPGDDAVDGGAVLTDESDLGVLDGFAGGWLHM